MEVKFDEIRKAVEVSNNLRNIEQDLYYSFSPLGSYYSKNNIDRAEDIKAYNEKMMKLRDEIIKFRKEFEALFISA
ncbi:MAG: hypothetical protein V2A75_07855 [Pseudomonadota bacterium]